MGYYKAEIEVLTNTESSSELAADTFADILNLIKEDSNIEDANIIDWHYSETTPEVTDFQETDEMSVENAGVIVDRMIDRGAGVDTILEALRDLEFSAEEIQEVLVILYKNQRDENTDVSYEDLMTADPKDVETAYFDHLQAPCDQKRENGERFYTVHAEVRASQVFMVPFEHADTPREAAEHVMNGTCTVLTVPYDAEIENGRVRVRQWNGETHESLDILTHVPGAKAGDYLAAESMRVTEDMIIPQAHVPEDTQHIREAVSAILRTGYGISTGVYSQQETFDDIVPAVYKLTDTGMEHATFSETAEASSEA